jgi:NADPH2:quinone reductase
LAFSREALRGHVDVVLDYVWGHPTEILLAALTGHDMRAEARGVRLIEIGEMAGPTISLPADALRSSGIEISGAGGGSVPHGVIFDAFPKMWALAASGQLHIDTERVPLADVESAWRRNDLPGRRLVIIP